MLSTRTKIALAKCARWGVLGAHRLAGRSHKLAVRRGGLRWELDLNEGIDLAIYLFGSFERATRAAYRREVRPGATVLDIGANIGAHTLPLAQCVGQQGRVHAFEPTAYAFDKLERNLELNPWLQTRVAANQTALGRCGGGAPPAELYSSWPLEASTGNLNADHGGLLRSTQGAMAGCLDEYVAEHGLETVDFIKIDVDGYEVPVLEGGQAMLRRCRPTLLMEVAPYVLDAAGSSIEAFCEQLRGHGYRLEHESSGASVPLDAGELRRRVPTGHSMNVLARARQ